MLLQGTPAVAGLDGSDVAVRSAGVSARAGERLDPLVAEQLTRLGVVDRGHVARPLTVGQIESADLILTAERVHRGAVVDRVPSAVRKTFTLRELAALSGTLGAEALTSSDLPERVGELVALAPRRRTARLVRNLASDDLPDLRRPTARAAERLVREIAEPVEAVLRLLLADPAVCAGEPEDEAAMARSAVSGDTLLPAEGVEHRLARSQEWGKRPRLGRARQPRS